MSAHTAVVHLVRHANGHEPLDAFLSSYESHDAGCEHDLILLCKGFPRAEELAPVRRRARGLTAGELTVSDDGFDITAYLAASELLPHRRLCFVNSFATVAAPRWLGLLTAALDGPGRGLAGATGSWGSHRSFALSLLRLPNGYQGALRDRAAMVAVPDSERTARLGRLRRRASTALGLPGEIVGYPGFPAPHVRTNAFVIERSLLSSLSRGTLRTKSAACRFESGTRGLTSQLRNRGLEAVVVGRDGVALGHEQWPDADLFWQGSQCDLLVADNQTRAYDRGSPTTREWLSRQAWGPRARPA